MKNIKLSSREIPCLDGEKRKIRYFKDKDGKIWLNADDMGMGMIFKPNTCGNCSKWSGCSIKDRDECPGEAPGCSFDPNVTSEQRKEAFLKAYRYNKDQLKQAGIDIG